MSAPPTVGVKICIVRDALASWIDLARLFASVNAGKFPRRVLDVYLPGFGIACGIRPSLLPRRFCCGQNVYIEFEMDKGENVPAVY